MIYTYDEAARIVELFENILDTYNIKVPSPDDEFHEPGSEAKLYGSTYADLLDSVEEILIAILGVHETDILKRMLNQTYHVPIVVSHEFSGSY